MKDLPIGLQGFQEIIEGDFLYVDKTQYIYELIRSGRLYFLSRPRRFGKSLLVNTLSEIFSGHHELFTGLYIKEKTDYSFPKYPVLEFNFARLGYKVDDFNILLREDINDKAKKYGITLFKEDISSKITELIETLAKRDGKVVFLVDEYDKPIVDFLTQPQQAREHQRTLRRFFSPLKQLQAEGHLRFIFITGVSKFAKVSIFSDLNNLVDITIDPLTHKLVGITRQELVDNFQPHIKRSAGILKMSDEKLVGSMRKWYNGYSYDGETFLYNPFSILNFFHKSRFGNFWFSTGTPTFLVETVRNQGIRAEEVQSIVVPEIFFDTFDIEDLDIYGLLFQTGYLTIKEVETLDLQPYYKLDYPNEEVRLSFIYRLLEAYTFQKSSNIGSALSQIQFGLKKGDVAKFITQLKILFSDISYHLHPRKKKRKPSQQFLAWEGYFQTIIYLVISFVGFHVETEITKHKGRLDLFVRTKDYVYLMELKLEESTEDAIEQIKNREYAAAYRNAPERVILVGINFSQTEKNIESWEMEEWQRA